MEGRRHTVRQSTVKHWRVAHRAERRLKRPGERFPLWEGLKSRSQATAFPFVAAEVEMNQRLPWSRGRFLAAAFPFVAAKIGAERRLPWLASQLRTTAFPPVVADFKADERSPWRAIQFPATAFSFVAADSGPHLSGLSEGQAEQGSQFHWLHQYERGVAS